MKFSVVVPSYNQAQYLEDCLDSIVNQRGVEKEIIVMDGGSTDGSAEIIERYSPHLAHWQSQKDGGQAAAINEGFKRATGDVFCWLCSDDMFAPAALRMVSEKFARDGCEFLTGQCVHFHQEEGKAWLTGMEQARESSLKFRDYIDQPSTFWTRGLWERTGPLNEDFQYAFDWDWFIRAEGKVGPPAITEHVYSLYRFHSAHKTSNAGLDGLREAIQIWTTHVDPNAAEIVRHLFRKRSNFETVRKFAKLVRKPHLTDAYLAAGCPHKEGIGGRDFAWMTDYVYWLLRKHKSNVWPL